MTKDEIKEALNCCRRYDSVDCLKCPLIKNKGYGCRYNLLSYASILITKQEKEIEQLKAKNEQLEEDIDMIIKEQKDDCKFDIEQAQIDVLNKLKKKTHNYYPSIDSYCISQHMVLVRDIDELIKEVEEQ